MLTSQFFLLKLNYKTQFSSKKQKTNKKSYKRKRKGQYITTHNNFGNDTLRIHLYTKTLKGFRILHICLSQRLFFQCYSKYEGYNELVLWSWKQFGFIY